MQSLNTKPCPTVKSVVYSYWNRLKSYTCYYQKNVLTHKFCKNHARFFYNHLTNGTGGWRACVHSNHNLKGMVSAQKHTLSLRSLFFIEVAV